MKYITRFTFALVFCLMGASAYAVEGSFQLNLCQKATDTCKVSYIKFRGVTESEISSCPMMKMVQLKTDAHESAKDILDNSVVFDSHGPLKVSLRSACKKQSGNIYNCEIKCK